MKTQMTNKGYRDAIDTLGLTQRGAARLLGIDDRTSRRYAAQEEKFACPVPNTAARFLRYLIITGKTGAQALKKLEDEVFVIIVLLALILLAISPTIFFWALAVWVALMLLDLVFIALGGLVALFQASHQNQAELRAAAAAAPPQPTQIEKIEANTQVLKGQFDNLRRP